MNKVCYIFWGLMIAVVHLSSAQNRNVYFLKNSGKEVQKDSADFVRIILEPDSGAYFSVVEYYKNNQRKFIGQVSAFEPFLVYEGSTLSFYENGKKNANITYKNGVPQGFGYYFYPTGKAHKIIEFGPEGAEQAFTVGGVAKYKLVSLLDTAGNELVSEGNGYGFETSASAGLKREGPYVNGVKHGKWKGEYEKAKATFEEVFEMGKLVEAVSVTADGKVFKYKTEEELPQFNGGTAAFNSYLSRTINYPPDARAERVTGRVVLKFVVEKDGSISDIVVVNRVHPSLDEEAVRILQRSPRWIPGKIRGMPVRVRYTVPISFQLGSGF